MASDVDNTLRERGGRYGDWQSHAVVVQTYKDFTRQVLLKQNKIVHPASMEALDMIFHKIGRIINGDPTYVDSWLDIAGYATLEVNRLNEESKVCKQLERQPLRPV